VLDPGLAKLLSNSRNYSARDNTRVVLPPLTPNKQPQGPGEVLFGFHDNFPSSRELMARMAGFDRWAIFTLEQPPIELARHGQYGSMPFVFDSSPAPAREETRSQASHARNGAATGAFIRATWPYYYRFLAEYDPPLARILAGQPLLPRAPDGGLADFQPAATRAEMTFRHTRPGGNARQIGTDRISTGRNLVSIVEEARTRGTGEIVRIDSRVAGRDGKSFLHHRDVLADLKEFEQVTQRELAAAVREGRGRNFTQRLQSRLKAIGDARKYVRNFGEGQGVGELPSKAISGLKSGSAELRAMRAIQGVRVAGGILLVYGAYQSVDRIAHAPAAQRPRVVTQEAGGWAGGFAGAWAMGELFAAGGAAIGVASGPGAIVTGIIGGVLGGIVGGIGGALGADWVYSRIHAPSSKDHAFGGFVGGSGGGGGGGGSW
jgi:hypothetical protein